ncbi:MAG: helix-turn-helix domain-containing protein [Proteobacteria bacterium]|nr:helix-turn-helix domain-containing protein [Pseudomonadota bacterium]
MDSEKNNTPQLISDIKGGIDASEQDACILKQNVPNICEQCNVRNADRLLTVEEVSFLIHFVPKSIYQLVHKKKIPFVKISGALRFPESVIWDWIRENTVRPGGSGEKIKRKITTKTLRTKTKNSSIKSIKIDKIVEQSRRKYVEN